VNIKCLLKGHKWRFAYNHGIPLGCSDELWDKLWADGTAYAVSMCERRGCEKQARLVDGKMEILPAGLGEAP